MPPRTNRPMNAQTQWKDQASSSSPQNSNEPTYTLPGVINYLTSEFTNLERFKIMTNLEKSEMKYRILHLEGEIKTLKYANQKQQARIDSLEKENRLLKSKNKDELSKEEPIVTNTSPEPDLESIKKSRQQLKESMKEIISLLKSPSTRLGELSISEGNQHELEEMIDNSEDDFVFGHGSNSPKSNLIAQFFDDDDKDEKKEDDKDEDVLERSITNESDVTVIESGDVEERPPGAEVKNDEISTTRTFENNGVTIELATFKDRSTITTSMNGDTTTKEVIINNPDEIRNAFALTNEIFLIVGKDINLLTDGGKEKVLIPVKSSFSRIDSTALINMTTPNDKSKTFGLAISGFSNGTKSFLSKIYQLTAEEQIKYKEIGSFNRKFLTKNKSGSNIVFVGWKYEETESAPSTPNKVVKSPPPSPSKNGNKNNTDSRLGLYNVMYRIGDQNCKVNLSSKQVAVID
ncbi:hypothetical protein CORT_0G01500 [Candida orthopsilosis Co 90-125]|uniref:Striatin N-terminal domain-containing protein n=1 Tax=Candida orthopsilosis (strain 90-125) TaxID=1136231 RepID=H8XAI8_CANO9|nr:hypothetical protein CORT_0G01500 [Candida orthopsilosis Co 90-125]CCG24837.1 hypothetical protein CORT_0G01500 [Candida orthopsilosis Co 90-125]